MKISDSQRRLGGFTLLELTIVIALGSALMVTFVSTQEYALSRAESSQINSSRVSNCQQVLQELEQGIRLSINIERAGSNELVLETIYFVDRDDNTELVRYSCDGTNLYRQIADDGSSIYGAPEILLTDIVQFNSKALEIFDRFESADYDSARGAVVIDVGDRDYDNVKDLASTDLSTLVDLDEERLKLQNSGEVTISPSIEKDGLYSEITFTPLTDGIQYYALSYELNAGNRISVIFEANASIRLVALAGGSTISSTSQPNAWKPNNAYKIRLVFEGKDVSAIVEVNGNTMVLGPINSGSTSTGKIRVASTGTGRAAWDNVYMTYPFVKLQLHITLDTGAIQIVSGGTARRQP